MVSALPGIGREAEPVLRCRHGGRGDVVSASDWRCCMIGGDHIHGDPRGH
jgi:hypothetical protein